MLDAQEAKREAHNVINDPVFRLNIVDTKHSRDQIGENIDPGDFYVEIGNAKKSSKAAKTTAVVKNGHKLPCIDSKTVSAHYYNVATEKVFDEL
mmetsp:Transcript_21384/g.41928  ORF Transcript_21384/g.41928 Transcript_21384/m.41928 type:complete len:94 (-) Transcript_21384:1196-1477(-)